MMVMPGQIILMGSGETSVSGGEVYEMVARTLASPLRITVLETPAGYELNAARVAGRVKDYLETRLQNYSKVIDQIPARKKGTLLSPDSPDITVPLFTTNMIFMGPGSPSYTVRQLENSLVWNLVRARHWQGAALFFASAAAIAIGAFALPVYEIYKVGEDPHWKKGLNILAPWGINLAIFPHWNNTDGGTELDTSHCFMGHERFALLCADLQEDIVILGIDEHTMVSIDLSKGAGFVSGRGGAHILSHGQNQDFSSGQQFSLSLLGSFRQPVREELNIPTDLWTAMDDAEKKLSVVEKERIPLEVEILLSAREIARQQKNWAEADRLRGEIAAHGWNIQDTAQGQIVERKK